MKKVLFVQKDPVDRMWFGELLALAGYEVHKYKDGESALKDIVMNGHDPFVLVGSFDMGDVYTPDEMRKCLDTYSRSTKVRYGMVAFGIPDNNFVKTVIEDAGVPYTTDSSITPGLIRRIDTEFERIQDNQPKRKGLTARFEA